MASVAARSGFQTVGTALLLAGAAVSTSSGLLFGFLGFTTARPLILVLAVLLAAGAVLTFMAWSKARAGQFHGAFVLGLVGALLPPVQLVTLAGAILVRLSPEAQSGNSATA